MIPKREIEISRTVFIPHSGWSKSVPTLNRFADRMVEHGKLELAAQECGISSDYARKLLARLRKEGMGL